MITHPLSEGATEDGPGTRPNPPHTPSPKNFSADLFTGSSRRAELVEAYPELAKSCDLLGLGSGVSLEDWCPSPDWALLILARAASPPLPASVIDWSQMDIPELIAHLINRHHRPLRNELHRIGILIRAVEQRDDTGRFSVIVERFARLETGQRAHLDYEESVVFPRCLAIEEASRGHARLNLLDIDVTTGIRAMVAGHDEATDGVQHILTLVTTAASTSNDPDVTLIHAGIVALATDLVVHARIENEILLPAALFSEEQVLTWRPSNPSRHSSYAPT